MVIEGAEKQAGRLWDKFGNYERSSEREMRYVSWCRSSSLTRQWHVFVTHRKACILWKLEGDISVSEREMQSGFEWWDTTCMRAFFILLFLINSAPFSLRGLDFGTCVCRSLGRGPRLTGFGQGCQQKGDVMSQ